VYGRGVAVADGDTLTVLDPQKYQHKIRLHGIDAPEKHQPYGTVAKQDLSRLTFGKNVRVEVTGKDRYGRKIGKVYVLTGEKYRDQNGKIAHVATNVNRQLIQQGSAWHYVRYSRDVDLAEAEKVARAAKLGLWRVGTPIPPWDLAEGPSGSPTAGHDGATEGSGNHGNALAEHVFEYSTQPWMQVL